MSQPLYAAKTSQDPMIKRLQSALSDFTSGIVLAKTRDTDVIAVVGDAVVAVFPCDYDKAIDARQALKNARLLQVVVNGDLQDIINEYVTQAQAIKALAGHLQILSTVVKAQKAMIDEISAALLGPETAEALKKIAAEGGRLE